MAYIPDDIKNILDSSAYDAQSGLFISQKITQSWKILQITPQLSDKAKKAVHRLNCLGSLFYFAKVVLGKKRLTPELHLQMCKVVEKDGLKEVIEIPRDHFKSTTYSECFPIWRALPFSEEDEKFMRALGYSDEWILWMKRAHNQDIRWLLVSEVINNAKKLGKKIRSHYEDNATFRWLFPEIVPDAKSTWTDESLHQKRTNSGRGHGEGTFDFIGVGSALQSRHYDGIIQDDLVGRDAIKSQTIMQATIEYHQLLVGAMDTQEGRDSDELIVGNRWGYNDLNSYIRKEETYFNFTTHSALGGCCNLHPYGTPIFPESFTTELLARWQKRLGTYMFSCQFLNTPINPAEVKFDRKNLRFFEFIKDLNFSYQAPSPNKASSSTYVRHKILIRHKVSEGDVEQDIAPKNLQRFMIVDPNHSGNEGRCRHAITITGVQQNPRRVYLLDVWAKSCGYEEFTNTILAMASAWKIDKIHIETVGFQKFLKYHMEYKIKQELGSHPEYRDLEFVELKSDRAKDAKRARIDNLGPIFERGEFWVNSFGSQEFLEEYDGYPSGQLKDVLDTLGYGPQVWNFQMDEDVAISEALQMRLAMFANRSKSLQTGY